MGADGAARSARRPRPTSSATGRATRRFEHVSHGIALELLQLVPLDDPVKISRLTLTNASGRPRRLSVTAYVEWVLGVSRGAAAPFVVTEIDPRDRRDVRAQPVATRVRHARRLRRPRRAGTRRGRPTGRSSSGRNGAPDQPAALARAAAALGTGRRRPRSLRRAADDGRAAAAGGRADVVFFLGEAANAEQARDADRALSRAGRGRRPASGRRALGRDARRRAGQDAGSLDGHPAQPLAAVPDARLPRVGALGLLSGRRRLRLPRSAAGRDGARWSPRPGWRASTCCAPRPGSSARATSSTGGTRPAGAASARGSPTTCSGCPTSSPTTSTSRGDGAVLDEVVPFLDGPGLAAGQHESYFEPRVSAERSTLFEHCARALDRSLTAGAHGLPLMGTGDWNDGMNAVGAAGQGRERLARLVPARGAVRMRAAGRGARRGQARRAMARARRGAEAGARARGLGRRLVPARVLRRRHAARLRRERRVPHRLDRAVLERDLRRRRPGPRRRGPWRPSTSTSCARRRAGAAAHAAVRPDGAGARLHQGLRARACARTAASTRTPRSGRSIAFAMLGDGDRAGELFAMLNPINHARTGAGGPALQGRAVRRGRRRLCRAAARRPRRLDLVHGIGRLDVPGRNRMDPRLPAARRAARDRSVHPARLAPLRAGLPLSLRALRHPRGQSAEGSRGAWRRSRSTAWRSVGTSPSRSPTTATPIACGSFSAEPAERRRRRSV